MAFEEEEEDAGNLEEIGAWLGHVGEILATRNRFELLEKDDQEVQETWQTVPDRKTTIHWRIKD